MESSIAYEKAKAFSVRIVNLTDYLNDKKKYTLSNQILRSGTSIGANLAEAQCSFSKRDFSLQGSNSIQRMF